MHTTKCAQLWVCNVYAVVSPIFSLCVSNSDDLFGTCASNEEKRTLAHSLPLSLSLSMCLLYTYAYTLISKFPAPKTPPSAMAKNSENEKRIKLKLLFRPRLIKAATNFPTIYLSYLFSSIFFSRRCVFFRSPIYHNANARKSPLVIHFKLVTDKCTQTL